MARLRQLNPGQYNTSSAIDADVASIVRYLNATEFGNKTLAELLDQLFSAEGTVDGIVEIRLDSSSGLQYRAGTYTDPDAGWTNIVGLSELRGMPGLNFGSVGEPVLAARLDYIANSLQTNFAYIHGATDVILAYSNGLLLRPGLAYDYTSDSALGTVTLTAPATAGDRISLYRVREASISGFNRADFVTASPQSVFSLPVVTTTAAIQVFLNGLLQRSGGAADYTVQIDASTVTFTTPVPAANLISIIIIDDGAAAPVTGLMTEGVYTDPATGLLRFDRLGIADGEVPAAKVAGLPALAAAAARTVISAVTPAAIPGGQQGLWLNTATIPAELRVWDGTDWVRAFPSSAVPNFTPPNANQYLRVNGAGTALIFAPVDLSAAIPVNAAGAANGVATLDSSGRLPSAQLPERVATESLYKINAGAVVNGAHVIKRVYRQSITITGLVMSTTSGTCSVEIQVNGVSVGSIVAVSSAPIEQVLGSPIVIDATAASKTIGYVITAAAAANNLEVTLSCNIAAV